MTQYIGVDIVEIDRVRQAIARWGDRFLRRVYTEAELQRYHNKPASLAARLAGKEAVAKALQETEGLSWQHIEVLSTADGTPKLHLYGRAKEQAGKLGLESLAITLAHSRDYAIAFVVGSTGPQPTPEAP
jgi:holo-[acyl-carrier protein] synthase